MCNCYTVQFSIYIVIADLIGVTVNCVTVIQFSSQYIQLLLNWLVLQWNVWMLLSLVLNTYFYWSTDWCYSELCECYWVQFSIYTTIAKLIGVSVNCVTVIQFSSQYILLLLKWLVLQWIVWLSFSSVLNTYCYISTDLCYSEVFNFIQFSSQYVLLLLYWLMLQWIV